MSKLISFSAQPYRGKDTVIEFQIHADRLKVGVSALFHLNLETIASTVSRLRQMADLLERLDNDDQT